MVNCRQAENPYTTHDLKLKIQLTVLSEELVGLSIVGSFVVGVGHVHLDGGLVLLLEHLLGAGGLLRDLWLGGGGLRRGLGLGGGGLLRGLGVGGHDEHALSEALEAREVGELGPE